MIGIIFAINVFFCIGNYFIDRLGKSFRVAAQFFAVVLDGGL